MKPLWYRELEKINNSKKDKGVLNPKCVETLEYRANKLYLVGAYYDLETLNDIYDILYNNYITNLEILLKGNFRLKQIYNVPLDKKIKYLKDISIKKVSTEVLEKELSKAILQGYYVRNPYPSVYVITNKSNTSMKVLSEIDVYYKAHIQTGIVINVNEIYWKHLDIKLCDLNSKVVTGMSQSLLDVYDRYNDFSYTKGFGEKLLKFSLLKNNNVNKVKVCYIDY